MNSESLLEEIEFDPADLREAAVYGARIALATVTRTLLQRRGWTQSRLGEELGVSRSRVSQLLNVDTDIQFSSVVAMLHVLGVDAASMLHESTRASPCPWRIDESGPLEGDPVG